MAGWRQVLALALLASACTGGVEQVQDATTATAESTPTEVGASPGEPTTSPIARRTRTYLTVDGEEAEEVVTPVDLLEAVRFGVEDGAWSEPEGVALALGGIVGLREPVVGLRPGDVATTGLTALARHATDLVDGGDVPPEVAGDLEAVLTFFSPTQEVLDRISEPVDSDSATAPIVPAVYRPADDGRTVRPVQGGSCRDVATQGFQPDLDTGEACYAFELEVVDGHALRVYFPQAWQDDPARMDVVTATMEALIRTQETFSGQLDVGDVNAVFSLSASDDETEDEAVPAATGRFLLAEACPITIYASGAGNNLDQHRQAMAHEAFHCLQDRNFSTAPFQTNAWWLEGSAEYFSNVVYPRVDLEHRNVPYFDEGSTTGDPTTMSYENAVFFQYFANRRGGSAGVLGLLEQISAGGAGLDTLTSVDGMEELWQEFVVAFMAGQVLDTNGSALPPGERVTSTEEVAAEGPQSFSPEPMVASRYRLEYAQEKRFLQSTSSDRRHAMVEWDSRLDPTAYTVLPEEVRSKCDDDAPYLLVVTATGEGATFTADVDTVEDASCDPCVLGPWEMQLATFEEYMGNVFASVGAGADFGFQLEGHYYFEFDEETNVRAIRQPLRVVLTGAGAALPPTDITGVDTGEYSADGEQMSIRGLSGGGQASLGGVTVGFETDPQSRGAPYTCDEDVLTIDMPDYGPVSFDRIEEIPDPESVEVEPGSPEGS